MEIVNFASKRFILEIDVSIRYLDLRRLTAIVVG